MDEDDHRAELAETLAAMSDEELIERWTSGRFTAVAFEVARMELGRRGIEAPEVTTIEEDDEESQDSGDVSFVTVARSLEPLQIEMLRARLQAEGITAYAFDAGISTVNALYSIAAGGVRLMVPRESAADARALIALIQSGRLALHDDEEPGQT